MSNVKWYANENIYLHGLKNFLTCERFWIMKVTFIYCYGLKWLKCWTSTKCGFIVAHGYLMVNFWLLMEWHGKEKMETMNLYGRLIVIIINVEKHEVAWLIIALALWTSCIAWKLVWRLKLSLRMICGDWNYGNVMG